MVVKKGEKQEKVTVVQNLRLNQMKAKEGIDISKWCVNIKDQGLVFWSDFDNSGLLFG